MEFLKTKRPHGVSNKKFEHFAKRHSYFFTSGQKWPEEEYQRKITVVPHRDVV